MMNAAAGIFLAARRKPKLPYDAEVEYLESTGTQWIDTGIPVDNSTVSIVDIAIPNTSSGKGYFGANGGAGFRFQITDSIGLGNGYHYRRGFDWPVVNIRKRIRLQASGSAYLDDVQIFATNGSYSAVEMQETIALFAIHFSPQALTGACMIYGCEIYEGGTRVRDFIPVRFTNELGQSEGAMYDRANPTVGMNPDGSARTDGLYRNRGTGAFSWGADKTA